MIVSTFIPNKAIPPNLNESTFKQMNDDPLQAITNTITDNDNTTRDISDLLGADRVKAYRRRLQIRSVKIYAAAARIQMPRDECRQWIEGDIIEAKTIKEFMIPYLEKGDENEVTEKGTGDAADLGEPPEYDEIRKELKEKLKQATRNAKLNGKQSEELETLYNEYEDVLRLKFANDPASKMAPFQIRVQDGAKPLKIKPRGYSPKALEVLHKTIMELQRRGLIYLNKNSRWAAPVLMIPKPGKPGEYRCCVDLKYINHVTIPIQWAMPDLENIIRQTRGAKYMATWDLLQGYWQGLVHENSQEYYSFMTPWGVYTPNRLPQGAVDSPLYFQASLQEMFKELIDEEKLIIWIDDILIHAKTWQEFQETTKRVLEIVRKKGIKLAIHKSDICNQEVQYCGRIVNGKGVTYNPRNYQSLVDMETPINAGELGQFVSALTWMIKGIPGLAELKEPLSECLNECYTIAGSREKRKYESIDLMNHGLWKAKHDQAFYDCKEALKNVMCNTHIHSGATLCMFTDASDRFYAALLTQVLNWDENLPVEQQIHLPVSTLSGKFTNSQVGWTTIEKESFPIVKACQDWEYNLLNEKGFRLYTDHDNIVSLFKPETIKPALGRSQLDKVHRWLHILSYFHIISMQHLKGDLNVWADLLSRWGQKGYHQESEETAESNNESYKTVKINKVSKKRKNALRQPKYADIMRSRYHEEFEIPSLNVIRDSQAVNMDEFDLKYMIDDNKISKKISTDNAGTISVTGKLWIPSSDEELQQRLLVSAHCGPNGHKSIEDAKAKLKEFVFWDELEEDVENFCHTCLSCEKVREAETIPIPIGKTLEAQKRLHILRADFMYIENPKINSLHGYKYVLVLKDEYSGYVELIPCKNCTHEPVAEAIAWFCARYGAPDCLKSDRGSHFKNKVILTLAKTYDIKQRFTLPYCPWSNGAVEIVNRSLRRVLRTAILEQDLQTEEWPYLLPLVMNAINGSKSVRLANNSPREVFMGLPGFNPFRAIYNPRKSKITDIPLSSEEFELHMAELMNDLEEMHLKVSDSKRKVKEQAEKSFRAKHGLDYEDIEGNMIPDVDFVIGDYVLVAVPNHKKLTKLDATWRGPYQVVGLVHTDLNDRGDVNNRIFEVQHLVTKTKMEAHAMRIKFYSDKQLDVRTSIAHLKNHITAQEASKFEIEDIISHKYDNDLLAFVVECKWRGFSDEENSFEPLHEVYSDVKAMVDKYLNSLKADEKSKLKQDLKSHKD